MNLSTSAAVLSPEETVTHPPRHLLTPLSDPGHFLLVLDNTSLEYFTTCPRSAYYKLVVRREAHARNAALTFGGALHEGLEQFHKLQYHDSQGVVNLDELEKFFTSTESPVE